MQFVAWDGDERGESAMSIPYPPTTKQVRSPQKAGCEDVCPQQGHTQMVGNAGLCKRVRYWVTAQRQGKLAVIAKSKAALVQGCAWM